MACISGMLILFIVFCAIQKGINRINSVKIDI